MAKQMQMRSIIALFALLVFLSVAVEGGFYFHSVREELRNEIVRSADDDVQEFAKRITISLSESQKISAALAGLKELSTVLAMQSPGNMRQADEILDHFQSTLQADVCYLLDHNGDAILSSNRNTPESFVGKHYAFRPFFKEAILGRPAIYPALGVVTKKRGIFYSYPVYGRGRKQPLGVLVIKSSTDYIEKELYMRHEGVMVLMDTHSIVFLSNRPEWLYHSLWRIPQEELSSITASQQFGGNPIKWGVLENKDGYAIDSKRNKYIIYQKQIANLPGWTATYMLDSDTLSRKVYVELFREFGPSLVAFCIIVGLAGVFLYRKADQEIHRRKLADDDQRKSLSLLQATLESTADGIVVVNNMGEIVSFNARFAEIWPLQDGMLSSRDNRLALEFILDKVIDPQGDRARMEALQAHPEEESFDLLEFKDGRIFERYSRPQRMRSEIVGRVWSFRDVTKRKKAEDRISRLNRLYAVLSKVNEAIVRTQDPKELYLRICRIIVEDGLFKMAWIGMIDPDTRVVTPVDSYGDTDGYLNGIRIYAADVPEGQGPTGKAAFEGKCSIVGDIEHDPRMLPWREKARLHGFRSSSAFPLYAGTSVIGALTVYSGEPQSFTDEEIQLLTSLTEDVSFAVNSMANEKKRLETEEALRRLNENLEQRIAVRTADLETTNKELEAFSYSVSHDLRAPLRHIAGFILLLLKRLKGNPDKQTLRYADLISDASKKMEMLIDSLLNFSRIGRSEMKKRKVNLNTLVRDVVQEIQEELKERMITWEIEVLPEILGDEALLRLAIVNLISNAVKFTSTRSHAEIRIGCKDEGERFTCSIADNGVGFNMEYAYKLFGVFQRLHPQEEFEGTGIGLANVQRIISRHGGRVWAEGVVGQGATFYFTLPKIADA